MNKSKEDNLIKIDPGDTTPSYVEMKYYSGEDSETRIINAKRRKKKKRTKTKNEHVLKLKLK